MTEGTPIEFPAATYFKVVARFGRLASDGPDPDEYPDRVTAPGKVTLSLSTPDSLIRVREADGGWRLDEVDTRHYVANSAGELVNPTSATVGVWLVDTSNVNVDPQNATYEAILETGSGKRRQVIFNQDSAVDEGGVMVVDLVSVISMAPSAGVPQLDGRVTALEGRVAVLEGKPTKFPPETHSHPASEISDATTVGHAVLTAVDAATARTAIGAGTSSLEIGPGSTDAAAGDHTHDAADLGSGTLAIARIPTGTTSATVALGNHTHSGYATSTHDHDSTYVKLTGAQTITGTKTLTAPILAATTPAAEFSANIAPALGSWTVAGGAAWSSPNLTIPSGGSASCTVAGVVAGRTYQVDVTRSSSSGGDMIVALGEASIAVQSWSNNCVTLIATESGSLLLTVGGGTWVATVQGIVVREVTAFASPVSLGFVARVQGTNVASGHDSQRSLTTGSNNVASGYASQRSLTTGSYNVASGYASQRSLTTGSYNVASGHASQRSLTTGSYNVATGSDSQYSLTTGSTNVATGSDSQYSLTTGSNNVASGHASQRSLTTGSNNVASGYASQRSLTTGSNNVASGHASQYSPGGVVGAATTTASRQVSVGHESGQGTATQVDDIVTIGYRALASGAKAASVGSGAHAVYAGSVALGADVTTTAVGQVAVGPRDVEIQSATHGLVLRSPDGSRWRATIDNAGALTWTEL